MEGLAPQYWTLLHTKIGGSGKKNPRCARGVRKIRARMSSADWIRETYKQKVTLAVQLGQRLSSLDKKNEHLNRPLQKQVTLNNTIEI